MAAMIEPTTVPSGLPLDGVRVVEMLGGTAEASTRFLADLGAEVVRVERPGAEPPEDLAYAVANANKLSVALDPSLPADRERLVRLLATADVWVTSARQPELDALDLDGIRRRLPGLVVASVTDFGLTGPYRDRRADAWTRVATAGVLCRSGTPGRPPLLPPDGVVEHAVAMQVAWCLLVAYHHRLLRGAGDHVDISLLETALQVFDPAFGAGPTAGYGRQWWDFRRGRPDVANYYPVFDCADGQVRLCVLSPAQWRALFTWLGEPAEFADPRLARIGERQRAHDRLAPVIAAMFAQRTADELVTEGQRRGVAIAPVLSLAGLTRVPHYRERGAFTDLAVGPDRTAPVADGCVEVDGVRAGIRHRAPRPGEHDKQVLRQLPPVPDPPAPQAPSRSRALEGLRVVDLGVVVVGAEAGRLFADHGADVIKVEHSSHPDASRSPFTGAVAPGFAWGHRGKQSLALDLRSPAGADLFARLLATADVLLGNSKPGTLDRLGFGPERLAEINPRLVTMLSSAVGDTGPWRHWMGYGPLVRAATGLTALWQDPDAGGAVADGLTVYPDHTIGRVAAAAALAGVIGRRRTGHGCRVTCAESEVVLSALSPQIAAEALSPGSVRPHGNRVGTDAPSGVYPCAGDDEWCVVSTHDDAEYAALAAVAGLPELSGAAERLARREELDKLLAAWTSLRTPDEVTGRLQAAGVTAAPMRRIPEFAADPQLTARRAFSVLYQPTVPEPLVATSGPFRSQLIAAVEMRPAPVPGQHTRRICVDLLGLTDAEVDDLVAAGVLEEPDAWTPIRTAAREQGAAS